MKRYDDDNQMHAALEVFLFDTLSDPNLEFASDVPQEASFAELDAAPEVSVKIKALGIEVTPNDLPPGLAERATIGMHIMRDYARGVSPDKQAARLLVLRAILDSFGD